MGIDNATVARRYLTELWGKGNVDLIEELVDANIVLRDPMTPELSGIDHVRERIQGMAQTFSDGSMSIDEVIVAGDRVTVRGTWRGVHTGNFFDIQATGRVVTCPSIELLKISNGKVVENISWFDTYDMFRQLGVLPSPDKLTSVLSSARAPSFATSPDLRT